MLTIIYTPVYANMTRLYVNCSAFLLGLYYILYREVCSTVAIDNCLINQ